ncbi:tyrosine-type recombinase/integrase [Patescibacteria group bacterium]|nr:tyrosine-type recombinase/integrase [Patescibacteria group bacterium]
MIELKKAHKNFVSHLEELGRSGSTLVAYGKDIEQLVEFLEREGIAKVDQIQLEHLSNFMQKLFKEDYTPKSISRKTNSTKTFFRYLQKSNYIVENVADRLKHPKVEIKAPRILSKVEYRALRDAAKDDLRSFAMIEVMLQTGITISELADMKMDSIQFNEHSGTLSIPTKNNRPARNVPLNKAAVDALKRYIETDRPKMEKAINAFITKTGNKLLVRNIRSTIQRFYKLAGVEHAKVNDLRHTFVAHHLANGANLLHVSKIAGHLRVSTTERYLEYVERITEEEKTELVVL